MGQEGSPLAGKNCLIMRDVSQAMQLATGVQALGGNSIIIPLISFKKRDCQEHELAVLQHLSTYDWLVFTSQNGVIYFFEQLTEMQIPFPSHVKVAAVGTKTESELKKNGISISILPKKFTGDQLAAELADIVSTNDRICIIKGNLARDIVGEELKKLGAQVDELIIYETFLPSTSPPQLIETVKTNQVDVLIFTSPSTVDHFMTIIGEGKLLNSVKEKWIACIGPVTKATLTKYGIPVHICPTQYTVTQLLIEMEQFFQQK